MFAWMKFKKVSKPDKKQIPDSHGISHIQSLPNKLTLHTAKTTVLLVPNKKPNSYERYLWIS